MKNAFYLILKALFFKKTLKFLSWLFGHAGKRLDKNVKVSFKIDDFIYWETNNYNTHFAQYLKR